MDTTAPVDGVPNRTDLFVGRLPQLARLRAVADAVRSGQAWTVRIDGPPGIGSTALARRFVDELADFAVVAANAAREESSDPFALADQLLSTIGRSERSATPVRYPALRDMVPAMVGAELVQIIAERSTDRPLALLVDGLQWADPESLSALRFALRRVHHEPVLTVLVGRRGRGDWAAAEHDRDWPDNLVRLDLDGLSAAEVAELAGRLHGGPLDDDTVRRLCEVTAGNPLYLGALLRGGAGAAAFLAGRSPEAPSLIQAVQDVLATFPPTDRTLLAGLAVLDRPADANLLSAVTDLDDPMDVARGLAPTGAVAIERTAGEWSAALAGAVWRDAVLAGLDDAGRRALHGRAAQASDVPQRWRHRVEAAAESDPDLCDEIVAAALTEYEWQRYARAADLLLLARRIPSCPDPDHKLMMATRLLVVAGHGRQALAHRPEVTELGASSDRSETLALLDIVSGALADARDRLVTAGAQLADHPVPSRPDTPVDPAARVALDLAFVHTMLGNGAQAVEAATEALRRLPEPAGADRMWVDAGRTFLAAGSALHDGAEGGLSELDWLPAAPTDASAAELPALAQRGSLRGLLGELDPGVDDLTTATRRRAHVPGFVGIEPHVHLFWCHFLRGSWAGAERALEFAAHAETLDRKVDGALVRALSAVLSAGRGDFDVAVEDADAANTLLDGVDHVLARTQLALARAAIGQARGSAPDVVSALEAIGAIGGDPAVLPDRVRLHSVWWLPTLADAQIATGRLDQAERSIDLLATASRRGAVLDVAGAWLEGQLLDRRGDHTAALRRFRSGIDRRPSGGEPAWHRAHLRATYGTALVAAGRTDEGVHLLRQAARAFTDMGALPFAERVQRTIATAGDGASGHRPARPWRAALTAREQEAAELVGLGWTNVEIGREMFVSPKTVEHHLHNVFRKLGVAGRRELRDLVQSDEAR